MEDHSLQVSGFRAGAVKGGIRGKDRLDIGLIVCDTPASAAGVFTTNIVKAAPVLLDMERLQNGKAQAILVNSGIANACTGARGMELARASAGLVSTALSILDEDVLVASTGVIGEQLDISNFENSMEQLAAGLTVDGFADVSRAIMTTDTVPKTSARMVDIDGRKVKLVGMAKGAGMIMPNMATMLCFIMTDAVIESGPLQALLRKSVEDSFNAITVDGDTSTNDSVLVLASGRAGNPTISEEDERFQKALDDLCADLAFQIVADGEGATKFVTVSVEGARSVTEANLAARTIANSPLVKTAFFGEDANWGRIIAALGRSGAMFDPGKVDISFGQVLMVKDGRGLGKDAEAQATKVLQQNRFTVSIDLNNGSSSRQVHTCDFSIDYVKINADYRS